MADYPVIQKGLFLVEKKFEVIGILTVTIYCTSSKWPNLHLLAE
jgi:hypothetical protein